MFKWEKCTTGTSHKNEEEEEEKRQGKENKIKCPISQIITEVEIKTLHTNQTGKELNISQIFLMRK